MRRTLLSLPSLIAILSLSTSPLQASGDGDTQLIEDLRKLAQEARQRNAADRWLQRSLDDLVARYDRPWQRTLLFEDFADGDFTRNPSWQVLAGDFQVRRGQGLTSSVGNYSNRRQTPPGSTTQQSPEAALSGLIVGALLDHALGPSGSSTDPAEPAASLENAGGPNRIRLQANVTNAFAMTTTVRTGVNQDTRFELSLLQSTQGNYGYRLYLDTGTRGFIELQRIRGGRGAVVENQPLNVALHDGRFHDISWEQRPDGTVSVKIDETEIFSVRDKAFRDGYPWLVLEHQSGELTVRSVRIDGV